ncbi:MAG: hypothetical protein IT447_10060 [Phycisphaerales bacterium]|nr:hypothetical protein [Phycisphaerales bacterium]
MAQTPDTLDDTIRDNAAGPKRAKGTPLRWSSTRSPIRSPPTDRATGCMAADRIGAAGGDSMMIRGSASASGPLKRIMIRADGAAMEE